MNPSLSCVIFMLDLVSFPAQIEAKAGVKEEVERYIGKKTDMNPGAEEEELDEQEVQVGHNHINCTITDYFCNPSGDLIEKIEDMEVHSAKHCHDRCMDDDRCKFFTFFNYRASPACYMLKDCRDKKPMCTVPGTCISGEKNCMYEHCPKLKWKKGDHTRWSCEGINPYKEDIPIHTACQTTCSHWTNEAGSTVTAMSTCQSDSTWGDPIPFPPGPLSLPSVLNKPNGPDIPCGGCRPLNMTYNPNLQKGTEFFCNPPVSWKRLPVKIAQGTQCHLLCDKMLMAITECKDDIWTGKPELGFWCSQEKAPVGHWVGKKTWITKSQFPTDNDSDSEIN